MSLEVIFLGTGGSVPTVERSLPAIALRKKGELILFDCGEGVQRQMAKAGLGLNRVTKVFITHMHGDHVLGLPGMIQTMSLLDRTKTLEIYGPTGFEDFVEAMEKTVRFTLTFPLEVVEVEHEGLIREEIEYEIHAAWADHSAPSLAYSFVEKPRPGRFYPDKARALGIPEGALWSKLQRGKRVRIKGKAVEPGDVLGPMRRGRKIVYTGDSRASEKLAKLAEKADLLIHDCTFDDDLAERAATDGHSTPSQAAMMAKRARVRQLFLTHISARYKTTDILLKQAREIFPRVQVAEDFAKVSLPLP
jgi:ribonuclease Z